MNVPAARANDCPPLSAGRTSVYQRTLHRACKVLGGQDATCRHLGCTAEALARWIEGVEMPPLDVFLQAVDVVLLAAERGGGRA